VVHTVPVGRAQKPREEATRPEPGSAPNGIRDRIRARTPMPRDVYVLGLIAFCVAVGFGVLVPVLPVFARSFGVGNLQVGAVISAFALMRLVSSPLCGRLIEHWSERVVMSTGIFIVAVSSGLAGISQSYEQLLVLRGVGGIGSAMFTVSAFTLLLGSVESGLRGRAAGVFQAGFLLGGMAGPALGGLLSAIALTAPFFFYAGTLAVAGTVGLLLLKSRGARPDEPQAARTTFRDAVRDARYQAACVTNLAQGWTSFGVRSSLVPVLVVEVLNRPTSWTGVAFAVAAVAQTIAVGPAGRFVDTVGRRPAMIGAGVGAGISIMVVPFAPNIWLLMLALCAYGVASAFLGTAPAAAVGDATGGGRSGTAVAAFSMCSDIGAIIGPLVAGFLADVVSYPVAFAVGAGLMIIAAGLSVRMPRQPVAPAGRTSGEPAVAE
jgi:MFS family permease